MERARVVLAEDHASVADQLRAILASQFEIVAMVTDGFGMIGASEVLKPDAIVADITMPGMDGIAAAAWILKRNSSARVVFVTIHREPEIMQRALELGALGYVLKTTAGEELLPAVEAALRGEQFASSIFGLPGGCS